MLHLYGRSVTLVIVGEVFTRGCGSSSGIGGRIACSVRGSGGIRFPRRGQALLRETVCDIVHRSIGTCRR